MNRQEFYRQEYRRLKPDWRDSRTIYRDVIAGYVNAETKILDVGCGHGEFMRSVYEKLQHTYGVDPDADALAKNTVIKNKFVASVESLPFEDDFFDLVVSEWVLEHLENPERAFAEIHRVLKPGGKVIFLTPNAWNYNVWVIRLVPNRFHDFFTRKLYDRQKGDTYPVRYRINSERALRKTLTPLGFKKVELLFNGDPSYISFNKPLFYMACAMERLLELKPFRSAKVHLIGVYEK